ncbi:glycoside hydrolase family 88 protein [Coniochaeta ligniaria NRRL 30616]|uniref:Glycoside hydrolase family 88 protein n=1 Tax=Coniochaeta ligniaria NRRL 30616 TaxID=1408157 RepID=A0A1J7IYG8_9PEZI|nr:glycoside hydrolase family 88 protein [Coniochaeta ligniaria NRRL 30616]
MPSPISGLTTPEKTAQSQSSGVATGLAELFNENTAAKIWRVAMAFIEHDPNLETYPEYILPLGGAAGKYLSKPATFWTCGFFPASLYCLLERLRRYPQALPRPPQLEAVAFHNQLLALCRAWSAPLHAQATRTNSHDLGFIMQSLRMDWELNGTEASLKSYVSAAESLATRYDERVRAIRSWDKAVSHSYEIVDKEKNFLIVIDSMCNMDLLFYAAHHSSNSKLSSIAATHAHTVLRTIVRPDNSTYHVANLDPQSGNVQLNMTHQGYSDDSTWSRGQAWAILGFTQTYMWTRDTTFLSAAQRTADYFLQRLSESPAPTHKDVPLWDFDAPPYEDIDTNGQPLRDTSAGMIAANGLLLLHQALQAADPLRSSLYLTAALRIASDTIGYSVERNDVASFTVDNHSKVQVAPGTWDAILKHSTANNNASALMRYRDLGLVYADYYFLELGNKLLRMGLV